MVDMSELIGDQIKAVMAETYETIWSVNLQTIKIIKKSAVKAGNMFYGDFDKGETEYSFKANVYAPDYSRVNKDFNVNTVNYTYHVYTKPSEYPNSTFIVQDSDIVEYNGKRYEIQNLNTQATLSPGQLLTQADVLWQEFDLSLIE